jgi:hypothetical protein
LCPQQHAPVVVCSRPVGCCCCSATVLHTQDSGYRDYSPEPAYSSSGGAAGYAAPTISQAAASQVCVGAPAAGTITHAVSLPWAAC